MSILGKHKKQSSETESYTIDYTGDLTTGDSVVTSDVTVTPNGLTLVATNVDPTSTRIWVAGGTNGVAYKIETTTSTGDGRVLQDEFYLTIKDY